MEFITQFQVLVCVCFMASVGCIAEENELEGLRKGSTGSLESHLILKIFSMLETDIQELKAEIADLKAKHEDKQRTVFAQIQLRGTHVYKQGDRVHFTSTVSNVGNAYKNQAGYFEAPLDGTYLFSVMLCTAGNNWVVFRLVQDGNIIGEGHPGDSSWHACAPTTVVTYMKTGSRVWVVMDRLKGGTISSAYGIPSFTGVFLNNNQKP